MNKIWNYISNLGTTSDKSQMNQRTIILSNQLNFLMLITSMGIFGFLSKAHIDATADLGISVVELRNLTTQEKIAKERLEYLLARANDPATASSRLDRQIQDTQKTLTTLATRKLPLLKEETKLTVEVGPIKYVAALIYGEQEGGIEKAVRLVIMLIMVVFDPLAVLLLIAANVSIKERQTKNITLYGSNTATTNSSIQIDKDNLTIMPNRSAPTIPRTKYDYTDELTFREREGNI